MSVNITTSTQPYLPNQSMTAQQSYRHVAELVAGQAAATPNAVALVAGGDSINYGELDKRANQLANYLITLGVGPETIVGLCLDRSPESVMCALAVLKAGGAYLPLDPAYPSERLLFMLNDARPRVLITVTELAGKFSEGPWKVVNIDRNLEIENYSIGSPVNQVTPDNLAYVIYTSGSTGRPKGVEISHGSLLNLVSWHRREFEVARQDRASHLASVGFDAAVWEVWPYLTAGASLHLPDEITRISPELLRDWLVTNEITISFLPTALAEALMTLQWPSETALHILLTGADTLRRYPTDNLPFELVNNYGPTECTVVATSGRVQNRAGGLPTIGRPIDNARVYILDENLQRVPTGASGELCVGGVGVARGYLNRPELTAKQFVPDPFAAEPQARLYRTGDLARYLDDGEIAYLGRIDEQIKILGHRIEPYEIEAVLDRHPAIASSVVTARGAAGEEKRLAAYLVISNGTTPAAADFRSFLQRELPDYMVPSVFVTIPAMPLTANGKVDRAALLEPNAENTLRDEAFIRPRTPVEQRLATTLCALLNLSEVSVNDNFFLLGGHSLLGTQLIVKIRSTFGVGLALRTLFDAPTIAELAAEIEQQIIAKVENMSEEEAQRLLA
ncbi:MAG TPA: non-ribosomal peptide synthetase [Pyrinomonadaceae bacterium]|nr:non-ribosomal peptide synthetase [Pyrinomonadaceae bacterium]